PVPMHLLPGERKQNVEAGRRERKELGDAGFHSRFPLYRNPSIVVKYDRHATMTRHTRLRGTDEDTRVSRFLVTAQAPLPYGGIAACSARVRAVMKHPSQGTKANACRTR